MTKEKKKQQETGRTHGVRQAAAEKKQPATIIGKRKEAVASAMIKEGTGIVKINSMPAEHIENEMLRLKVQEPMMLAGAEAKKFDISVSVHGGGTIGQSEAVRQSIAKCLVQKMPQLRETFMHYDRSLLVADPRRKEQHKPPHSSWGARRYKQKSKR